MRDVYTQRAETRTRRRRAHRATGSSSGASPRTGGGDGASWGWILHRLRRRRRGRRGRRGFGRRRRGRWVAAAAAASVRARARRYARAPGLRERSRAAVAGSAELAAAVIADALGGREARAGRSGSVPRRRTRTAARPASGPCPTGAYSQRRSNPIRPIVAWPERDARRRAGGRSRAGSSPRPAPTRGRAARPPAAPRRPAGVVARQRVVEHDHQLVAGQPRQRALGARGSARPSAAW